MAPRRRERMGGEGRRFADGQSMFVTEERSGESLIRRRNWPHDQSSDTRFRPLEPSKHLIVN